MRLCDRWFPCGGLCGQPVGVVIRPTKVTSNSSRLWRIRSYLSAGRLVLVVCRVWIQITQQTYIVVRICTLFLLLLQYSYSTSSVWCDAQSSTTHKYVKWKMYVSSFDFCLCVCGIENRRTASKSAVSCTSIVVLCYITILWQCNSINNNTFHCLTLA